MTTLAFLADSLSTSSDKANLCFIIAFLALLVVGIISLVQHSILPGIAWIATGVIALGFFFLT